jgi:hypothetical protein
MSVFTLVEAFNPLPCFSLPESTPCGGRGTMPPSPDTSYTRPCPQASSALDRRRQHPQFFTDRHMIQHSRTAAYKHKPTIEGATAGQTVPL